jgi:hypothetical protein
MMSYVIFFYVIDGRQSINIQICALNKSTHIFFA